MKPLEILVVDDEPLNLEVTKVILAKQGHEVTLAADGKEAVEMCMLRRFDAVVIDIQMPRMNGVEATRLLRADTRTRHLPIVCFSANTDWSDEAFAAGCDAFLKKPFKRKELLDALTEAVNDRTASHASDD